VHVYEWLVGVCITIIAVTFYCGLLQSVIQYFVPSQLSTTCAPVYTILVYEFLCLFVCFDR
jgi:hypothetical protein